MDPDSHLRKGIVRSLFIMFIFTLLVSCDLVNPFSSSPAPISTRASDSGPVTITTKKLTSTKAPDSSSETITTENVSRLVEAWNDTIGGTAQFSTPPTVADGMIYIGLVDFHTNGSETDTLYALDVVTGNERWSLAISGLISTAPIVADGVVYIDSVVNYRNNILEALDARSGTRLWSYGSGATTRGFFTAPTVANGVVAIDSNDENSGSGILEALDGRTGTRLWSYSAGATSAFSTRPVVINGVVAIGSYDMLSALDSKSGTRLWNYFTGGSLASLPVATNNKVYVNSLKTLYAFGLATPAPTPTATSSLFHGTTTAQHLIPSINKAPVFADLPGLHIQSMEGLQCPLSHGPPLCRRMILFS
jgi:outer membrane protein assembly factor BamB